MARPPLVVGMGGSLRTPSTSLTALCVAVDGAPRRAPTLR